MAIFIDASYFNLPRILYFLTPVDERRLIFDLPRSYLRYFVYAGGV